MFTLCQINFKRKCKHVVRQMFIDVSEILTAFIFSVRHTYQAGDQRVGNLCQE
jgi:hypothetical protein